MLFRAVSDNLKNLVFLAKTRSPGLWLTSVTVFTFSLHSWQCLEHRCKNGRNALLILKFFLSALPSIRHTIKMTKTRGMQKEMFSLFSLLM